MNIDFICRDTETMTKSLLNYFECDFDSLCNFLMKDWVIYYEKIVDEIMLKGNDDEYCDFSEYLYKNTMENFKPSEKELRMHWFHGTRVINPETIKKYGLLPLQKAKLQLSEQLDSIARKIGVKEDFSESDERNWIKFLMDIKLGSKVDLGPCSVLMYDALIHPNVYSLHDYGDEPEFIRDYSNWKYGNQSEAVIKEFKKMTKSVVVEFIEPSDSLKPSSKQHVVGTALNCTYSLLHYGYGEDSLGLRCNTCYSNYGETILPKQIVDIIYI